MLKSTDLEMVRLGALLLTNLPRREWTPILRECENGTWYFRINHNKIVIDEILNSWGTSNISGGLSTTGYTVTYTSGNNYILELPNHSHDFDEERKQKMDRKSEKLRRQSIKYRTR